MGNPKFKDFIAKKTFPVVYQYIQFVSCMRQNLDNTRKSIITSPFWPTLFQCLHFVDDAILWSSD